MNRSELVARLAAQQPLLSAADCGQAVTVILDALGTALASGERAEIRGFGSFIVNHRPPRDARNPKTGEIVHVPARRTPRFKAGKDLRERVDYR